MGKSRKLDLEMKEILEVLNRQRKTPAVCSLNSPPADENLTASDGLGSRQNGTDPRSCSSRKTPQMPHK